MRTTKPAAILLALVLLTATAAQSAKKPAKKPISNTRTASCLVKVTFDPAVLPLSDVVIDYLLHSSGVAGKAAREVLNISPDDAFQLFRIEEVAKYSAGDVGIPPESFPRRSSTPTVFGEYGAPMPGEIVRKPKPTFRRSTGTTTKSTASAAEQTILFKLRVVLPDDAKPAAEEFMNALIENLRQTLSDAFDDYRNKIIGQQRLAFEEADRAERKLVSMQKQLRNISDSRNLSRNVILDDISNLRKNIRNFEMQKASNRIEMESIAKEIADTEVKIREKVANDPITIELQRIVDIQTDSLKRTQELVKEGAVSSAEVEDVLEKLARARIEIAQRREQISRVEGGDRLNQLSSKLAVYTQKIAQYELTLSGKKEQLDEAMDFLDRTDDYELLYLKAGIARQSLQEALLWRERMDRKARLVQPPAVTVLGGS